MKGDLRAIRISYTFRKRKLDNFSLWRKECREKGIIPDCKPFKLSVNLAILTGLVLGDGHIEVFPRCERLTITLGTDKPNLIEYAATLVENVFNKKPKLIVSKKTKCIRVSLYQREISKRLKINSGNKRFDQRGIPRWIWKKKRFLIGCLKGLYEAEASLCIHLPTSTYNFAFHNINEKLLIDVKTILLKLGLHPETRDVAIRIRRKNEVKYLSDLLAFRKY